MQALLDCSLYALHMPTFTERQTTFLKAFLNLFLALFGPFWALFDPFLTLFNAKTQFLALVGENFPPLPWHGDPRKKRFVIPCWPRGVMYCWIWRDRRFLLKMKIEGKCMFYNLLSYMYTFTRKQIKHEWKIIKKITACFPNQGPFQIWILFWKSPWLWSRHLSGNLFNEHLFKLYLPCFR